MDAVIFSSYFPCNSYISKFLIYDKVVIDIFENYIKQTYRNRCKIITANGVNSLTVPVKKNKNLIIKEIEIDYSEQWQKNHYRSILSAYKNSAFYDFYMPEIISIFSKRYKYLIDLNSNILEIVFKILKYKSDFTYSDTYVENKNIKDYRDFLHPKAHKNKFENEYKQEKYIQVFSDRHGFVADLSILDLIFNLGPLSLSVIKQSIRH